MKKIILLTVLVWSPFLMFAKSNLSRQEKTIVKALKKQYKNGLKHPRWSI